MTAKLAEPVEPAELVELVEPAELAELVELAEPADWMSNVYIQDTARYLGDPKNQSLKGDRRQDLWKSPHDQ